METVDPPADKRPLIEKLADVAMVSWNEGRNVPEAVLSLEDLAECEAAAEDFRTARGNSFFPKNTVVK